MTISVIPSTSNAIYDVFAYLSNTSTGAVSLELSSAWMSDTARMDSVSLLDGVYVKSSNNTRRLLGTIRAISGGFYTEDSRSRRFIWNLYNMVPMAMRIYYASNWTYSATTVRQAAGAAANQIEVVAGMAGNPIFLSLYALAQISTAANYTRHGWGVNSTTTFTRYGFAYTGAANGYGNATVTLSQPQRLGYSKYVWLEQGSLGTVTITNQAGAYSGAEGVWPC
jgi:hypothetical protein